MQQENYLVLVAQMPSKDLEYEELYEKKLFEARIFIPELQQSVIAAPDNGPMVVRTFQKLTEMWELPSPDDQLYINHNFLGKYALSTRKSDLQALDNAIGKYLRAKLPGGAPVVIVGKPIFLDRIATLVGFSTPSFFWGRKEILAFEMELKQKEKEVTYTMKQPKLVS